MSGFLLDTNIPSELTRQKSEPHVERWLDEANDEELYLSVISLGEILKGITLLPASKRRDSLQKWLDATLRPWFEGRLLGKQIRVADGLILATALHHNLTVVTRNVKDFAGHGVTVLNPWDE